MALTPAQQQQLMMLLSPGAKQANASSLDSFNTPQPQVSSLDEAQLDPSRVDPNSEAPAPLPSAEQSPSMSGLRALRSVASTGSDPGLRDIQKQLREHLERSRGEQEKGIELDKMALAGQYGKKQQLDLSPSYDLVRMISGNKNAGAKYEAPEDITKGDLPLKKQLSHDEQALTDDQTNQLKAELQNKLLAGQVGSARADAMRDNMLMRFNQRMSEALDPSHASNATTFGNFAKSVTAAKKLEVLAEQQPDLNFSSNQMTELATATAALLSNGSVVAQSQIEHLLPKGVERSASGIANWLTGDPHGTGQEGFAKQMLETAARERALAETNLYQAQKQRLSGFERFRKMSPDEYDLVKGQYVVEPKTDAHKVAGKIKNNQFSVRDDVVGGGASAASASGALSKEEQSELDALRAKHGKR